VDFLSWSKKVVALKHLKIDNGQIWLYGMPMVFLSPSGFARMQEVLNESLGEIKAGKEIYQIFFGAGEEMAKVFEKNAGVKGAELIRFTYTASSTGGWGMWKEVFQDTEKLQGIYNLKDSPIPKYIISSKKPVCHSLRGLISGVWKHSINKKVDCIETACKAQGYPQCSFQIGTKEELSKKHLELVKEQLL
jgi:predicted hydrocarbon binding protein